MVNLYEIVKNYLIAHGYDGLYNTYLDCGCEIDDLFPCDSCEGECQPGYKVDCDCTDGSWREHDFHIVSEKPKKDREEE